MTCKQRLYIPHAFKLLVAVLCLARPPQTAPVHIEAFDIMLISYCHTSTTYTTAMYIKQNGHKRCSKISRVASFLQQGLWPTLQEEECCCIGGTCAQVYICAQQPGIPSRIPPLLYSACRHLCSTGETCITCVISMLVVVLLYQHRQHVACFKCSSCPVFVSVPLCHHSVVLLSITCVMHIFPPTPPSPPTFPPEIQVTATQ